MKIKHIEAIPLVRKLENTFQGGTYQITARNTIVTRVELTTGQIGETFGGDEDQYQLDVVRLVNEVYRPLLVDTDVRDVEQHWERMWHSSVDLGNRGIHALDLAKHCVRMQAMAALDIAIWDALGKALGQPVYKLIGGYRDSVPVIAIGGYVKNGNNSEISTEIESYLALGVRGMKLKVGKLSVDEDIERTRLARKIGGEDFHLCVDANQAWSVRDAMRFARSVRDLNLAWIEEPVCWNDQIEGNARVRTIGIPVNAGQGEISRHGCRELLLRSAVDILNVDATIAGGVTEWRRIAAMAHCTDVYMAHHEEPQIALHLLAGVPNGLCVEIFPDYERDPLWFDLPLERPAIRDGQMILTDAPGFGIALSSSAINQFAFDPSREFSPQA